jgi:chitinase
MSRTPFPTPYAGTYYPIYNFGPKQYIEPTPKMPFNRVSAIFVAFAHAYPSGPASATLQLEHGQPDEPARLRLLMKTARDANSRIKILISLGWGHDDWTYIAADYASGTNAFPASVVALIREYGLDGFDIDDESINGSSGDITQEQFNGVVWNLRRALDAASAADGKPYFLTIAPAGGAAEVTRDNMDAFDLINAQCYGWSYPDDFTKLGYPRGQVAWGINTENNPPAYPTPAQYQGLAGIFNWTMSADSVHTYPYTLRIAQDVGYRPTDADRPDTPAEPPALEG